MEYRYSKLVDPQSYNSEVLCDGIPVRRHTRADLERAGTLEAQADWTELVAPLGDDHHGGLGLSYGFMEVSMPECLPERFEIVSYANEFAFLYDDLVDVSTEKQVQLQNDELLGAFVEGSRGRISEQGSGKRRIQAKILARMMEIDRPRAMLAMKAWATFVETSSGREHHRTFEKLADYLPYRCKDVGHMFWHALVTFGCALSIPQHEEKTIAELVMPAVRAASLTNDLFSFEKEYYATLASGKKDVPNGVWVLMRERHIPLDEAKNHCRVLIHEAVAEYVQIVQTIRQRIDLTEDARKYVEFMQYSVSGNVVWSLTCPRYHQRLESSYGPVPQFPEAIFGASKTSKRRRSSMDHCRPPTPDNSDSSTEESPASPTQKKSRLSLSSHEDVIPLVPHLHVNDGSDSLSIDPLRDSIWTNRLPCMEDTIVLEPFQYLNEMPSKGIRDKMIDALNFWLETPSSISKTVKEVTNMLHSSSLLLDDLQDNSPLRRGRPSAHIIYGAAQTINSATLIYVDAVESLRRLESPELLKVFTQEVRGLLVGQSYDIYWAKELHCPSIPEYLQMVDGKTGGLFRLLTKLLLACSPHRQLDSLDRLTTLLGRYFQIRDDYQNLASLEYTAQKGFCEDLDEGKYSLPLIHALHNTSRRMRMRGILQRRLLEGGLTIEQKEMILSAMKATGSLKYTMDVLKLLHTELDAELQRLDSVYGKKNYEVKLLVSMLKAA